MVAAKIEMVNLRIEITPSSEHPAQLIVTPAETIIRGRPRARVSAATHVELRPCNYRLRTGGQPCNKRIAQAPTMHARNYRRRCNRISFAVTQADRLHLVTFADGRHRLDSDRSPTSGVWRRSSQEKC